MTEFASLRIDGIAGVLWLEYVALTDATPAPIERFDSLEPVPRQGDRPVAPTTDRGR